MTLSAAAHSASCAAADFEADATLRGQTAKKRRHSPVAAVELIPAADVISGNGDGGGHQCRVS